MALSSDAITRRVLALAAIDQLRLAAAVAGPHLEELMAAADAAGVSRHRVTASTGVPHYVGRWAIHQRQILQEGSEHQVDALAAAEGLLLELAETGEPGQVQPSYRENISAMK